MALKNIELFDLYVGKIFVKLYENFPLRIDISPCKMIGKEINEDTLEAPKECDIFIDTMIWLEESGYIKYSSQEGNHYFLKVVLTAKGLELLKAVPPSVETKKGIGERLTTLSKIGSEEAIKEAVNIMLSMGVKMFS